MNISKDTIPAKISAPSKKDRVLSYARILISFILLSFIIFKNYESLDDIYQALLGIVPFMIVLAVATHLLTLFIESLRWDVLLRAQSVKINKAYLFSSMMVGYFYNNLLPSNIGGDFYRIYDISKNRGVALQKSASAVFMERFFGLISITLFFAATSFSIYRMLKNYVIIISSFLGIAFVLFIMLSNPSLFKIDRIFKKFKRLEKTWSKIHNFSDAVKTYIKKPWHLALGLFLNIVCQLLFTVMFYFISMSLGLEVSFATYAFMVPVIFVLIGIPISIGGLGVRENTIVFILNRIGVPNDAAVVFSFLVLFVHIFNAVIGGVVYFFKNIFYKSKSFI